MKLALPGHRHTGDLEARIQALFTHHRNRGETLAIVQRGPPHRLPGGQPDDLGHQGRQLGGLPLNQKWFATGEALAHLEYLMEEGQVAQEAGPEGAPGMCPKEVSLWAEAASGGRN